MTAHDHRVYVEGCFRCELGRDELAWDGPFRVELPEDGSTEWTPLTEEPLNLNDQRVTVAVTGFVPRDYWAKAIGLDSNGCTTYKLLPLDRA